MDSYYHGATYQLRQAKVESSTLQAASAAFEALNKDLTSLWCTASVLKAIQNGTFDLKVPAHPSAPHIPSGA